MPIPIDLRCEFRINPIGIDEPKPRLSWRLADERAGVLQSAYEIQSASTLERLHAKPDLWKSGQVASDQTLDIAYGGKKLASRMQVWWRVRIWDEKKQVGPWSQPATFEMGLLRAADWKGQWIGRLLDSNEASQPCPHLRREFTAAVPVISARIYATARGCFELRLNGEKVGSDYFTPGWTNYEKRIQYLVYDVTGQVKQGGNVIGAILADGWYAGYYVGWMGKGRNHYGDVLSLLLQLELTYADGSTETISSSPEWSTATGPILSSDHYNGETYDARLELGAWSETGFDASSWKPATVLEAPSSILVAKRNLPVRKQESLQVVAQTEPRFGVHVFDLGQNMVGWARIRIRAQRGDAIRIRFAEMLNDDGTLYTENLRSAKATDHYLCRGDGEEIYEPSFTFHGFRYVELTGLREKPRPTDVTGIVVHSEIPAIGAFECSNAKVNHLQSNIVWGQKGNFFEAPTDCPQRDERLGWTGDAQVFMPTACFNRDVAAFFEKWCVDLSDDQAKNGGYPHVAPDMLRQTWFSTGWADAGIICPWTQYLYYGDKAILDRQYDSMARWIGFHKANSKDGISRIGGFGDWLALDMQEGDCGRTPTPIDLVSTAYFARVTAIMVEVSRILGRKKEETTYRKLLQEVKTGFNREFVAPNGRVVGDTQTGYLMALGFDLLPEKVRPRALSRLVELIEQRGTRLTTGFLGTPLIAPVLSRFGRSDLAYKLLLQENYPSWFYSINQGATTMWERWNSYTKDKGFGDVGMNSFNHYAYGCIGEWMYSTIGGISPDPKEPGFKHIIMAPQPGGGLTSASASLLSRHGRIATAWALKDGTFELDVVVPPNTHATVTLPNGRSKRVKAGSHHFACRIQSSLA